MDMDSKWFPSVTSIASRRVVRCLIAAVSPFALRCSIWSVPAGTRLPRTLCPARDSRPAYAAPYPYPPACVRGGFGSSVGLRRFRRAWGVWPSHPGRKPGQSIDFSYRRLLHSAGHGTRRGSGAKAWDRPLTGQCLFCACPLRCSRAAASHTGAKTMCSGLRELHCHVLSSRHARFAASGSCRLGAFANASCAGLTGPSPPGHCRSIQRGSFLSSVFKNLCAAVLSDIVRGRPMCDRPFN